jgi:branched-chain amino acid transport system ATP-binding protein
MHRFAPMSPSSTSTSAADPVLRVADLWAAYTRRPVLRGVSLEVRRGETVAVIGLNGAGKTTLLRTIMGYLRPLRGSVRLLGREIAGRAPHEVARLGVGYVPQEQNVFPDLTVEEHLEVGASMVAAPAVRRKRLDRACALFPRLAERMAQKAKTLSGGERQMLTLARALMADPILLMLDEPSLGLAPMVISAIVRSLDEIRGEGTTILLIEQNAALALGHSDRAYLLELGELGRSGPSAELAARPDIRETYLWGDV